MLSIRDSSEDWRSCTHGTTVRNLFTIIKTQWRRTQRSSFSIKIYGRVFQSCFNTEILSGNRNGMLCCDFWFQLINLNNPKPFRIWRPSMTNIRYENANQSRNSLSKVIITVKRRNLLFLFKFFFFVAWLQIFWASVQRRMMKNLSAIFNMKSQEICPCLFTRWRHSTLDSLISAGTRTIF